MFQMFVITSVSLAREQRQNRFSVFVESIFHFSFHLLFNVAEQLQYVRSFKPSTT
jgi:hypothetical protein